MIYIVMCLIVIAVIYGFDSSYYRLMKEARKNHPEIKAKLNIPFYSIYAYYKWRKEIKNANRLDKSESSKT